MLLPKRVKYRKMHRGRRTGIATRGATVAFGDFGLQAMEACWMSNRSCSVGRPRPRCLAISITAAAWSWDMVWPSRRTK